MSEIIFSTDVVDRVVFHFNKQSNIDSTLPAWVIKHKGQSYYVNHLNVLPGVGFSTKETPDNSHTKGSLQIRGKLEIKNEDSLIIATVS